MANSRTSRCYQNTTNIAQVLRNKAERTQASYIISPDGNDFIRYKGAVLTVAAFDELLPIEVHNVTVKGIACSNHQRLVA